MLIGIFLTYVIWLIFAIFVLYGQTHQAWVALDQWLHCLCYEDAMADETFSARCWREYTLSESMAQIDKWGRRVKLIDRFFGAGHCKASYESERAGLQLPKAYRQADPLEEATRRG